MHRKAMIGLALLLAASCGNKSSDDHGEHAVPATTSGSTTAGVGAGTASGSAVGSNPASGSAGSASATGSSAGGALPKDCDQWKDAVERLARCDQMPEATRKALRQAYDTAAAAWSSLPAEDRAHLAGSCQAGATAILESAKLTCGW
jgi:hypothetical protein